LKSEDKKMVTMKTKCFPIVLAVVFTMLAAILSGCGTSGTSADEQGSESAKAPNANLPKLPEKLKERGKLVVGVKVDYPPLGYLDEMGENAGYEIDIVKKMAEYAFGTEKKVEFVAVNATNRIPFLTSGKIDFIAATLGTTEERKKEIDFTTPFFEGGAITVVPKGSSIKGPKDLAGKKVIVIKGSTASLYLDEEVPTAKQMKFESIADAFRALKDGRADAMLHDVVLMSELIKKSKDYTTVGEQVAVDAPMAIGVRKNEPEMLDFLNASLEEMRKEDYFKKAIQKYMQPTGDLDPMDMIPRPQQ
jgi:polar amino acid transport system substrate-binding protein